MMPVESDVWVVPNVTANDPLSGSQRGSLACAEFSRTEATIMAVERDVVIWSNGTGSEPPLG